jgi:hypothetical protein
MTAAIRSPKPSRAFAIFSFISEAVTRTGSVVIPTLEQCERHDLNRFSLVAANRAYAFATGGAYGHCRGRGEVGTSRGAQPRPDVVRRAACPHFPTAA